MKNTLAPKFNTLDQMGVMRNLEEFKGQKILLYFYPKDMTPGCTTETIGFQERKSEFEKENTIIIGVSKDSVARHVKFCDKHNLDIILLSDEETKMIQDYKVWKEKSMFGKKLNEKTSKATISNLRTARMGISRESFLINEKGMIMNHWEKVKPISHPQEVLEYIKNSS